MADITIGALPTKTQLLDADMVVIDDGAQSYKMYYAQFKNLFRQAFTELFVDVAGDTMTGALIMDGVKVFHREGGQNYPVLDTRTRHITQTYANGTSWYRIWSDGWCEQGGRIPPSGVGFTTVTLLKPYKDTNYTLSVCPLRGGSAADARYGDIISESQITVGHDGGNGASWRTCGYIS